MNQVSVQLIVGVLASVFAGLAAAVKWLDHRDSTRGASNARRIDDLEYRVRSAATHIIKAITLSTGSEPKEVRDQVQQELTLALEALNS